MKHNIQLLIEGAETLADILRDYEVHDSHDCEMLKDGRMPEGQDKFISVARLIALQNELRELQKKFRKEIYGDENYDGTTAIPIEEILGVGGSAEKRKTP